MINTRTGRLVATLAAVGLAGFLAAGCGQQQAAGNAAAAGTATAAQAPQNITLDWSVVNGGNPQHKDWPFFSADGKNPLPASVTLPANATVTLTIKNYDDGGGTVPAQYAKVAGTVGGVETVNGVQESTFKASGAIAHTLTVPGLGLNIPLPAATTQGNTVQPATVTVTFKTPAKTGTYTWQCYQPCGTSPAGWGGTMAAAGWMSGTFEIR